MKDKMFVIPGGFVPYNDTVTLLTYKRLRNLDLDIDVFAFNGESDPGLVDELKNDSNFDKFCIKHTTDLKWAIPRNNPFRLPISLFFMLKYTHDALIEFEKTNYRYLFSSIVPGISHIAAYRIKKKHPEVEWYASFSDPFKGSPYKNTDLSKRSIFYKIAFKVGAFFLYNDKYEEVAVLNADKIVFICEEQRDFTLKQYANYEDLVKKSIIMPLTFIPEWKMYKDLKTKSNCHNNPKIAVHLGRLYGLRDPGTFIEALCELKNEIPDLKELIEFHQYSEIQFEDKKRITDYGLNDVFIIHDKVTYDKSIEVMKRADILVLFDSLMPNEAVQPYLPSKIVEYILLQKPILAICDSNSPSYRILKENGYRYTGSTKEIIKENILKIIYDDNPVCCDTDVLNCDNYNMLEL